MFQSWGLGPLSSQANNPFSTYASTPSIAQLLQAVPQQLQQLQQLEYVRHQQLQQIQQLIQYVGVQLQYLTQQQPQQSSFGLVGQQGIGQPFQTIPSAFSAPPLHVM